MLGEEATFRRIPGMQVALSKELLFALFTNWFGVYFESFKDVLFLFLDKRLLENMTELYIQDII